MLKILNDLPDNILGISAEGKITGPDYETILIPAVEDKLKRNKKTSLLYYPGNEYTWFDLEEMLDDAKIGFKHLSAWEKVALVSLSLPLVLQPVLGLLVLDWDKKNQSQRHLAQ